MEGIEERSASLPTVRLASLKTIRAAAAGLLILLAAGMTLDSFTVTSASMSPTLQPGDSVLVTRLFYLLHPPRRGDIIAFRYPQGESRIFAKRVIALPGEVVEEQGGRFYVDNMPLAQEGTAGPAADDPPEMRMVLMRIPPQHLFVLGDNRNASLDSRFWGAVDQRNVIGKALFVYWSHGRRWWNVRWQRIGQWLH